MTVQEQYNQIRPIFEEQLRQKGYDVNKFLPLLLAQSAYEGGWWQKESGKNNYFGIKGSGTKRTTHERVNGNYVTIDANFKDYNSLEDGVADYISILERMGAFQTDGTAKSWANALKNHGYFTEDVNQYAKTLQGTAFGKTMTNLNNNYKTNTKAKISKKDNFILNQYLNQPNDATRVQLKPIININKQGGNIMKLIPRQQIGGLVPLYKGGNRNQRRNVRQTKTKKPSETAQFIQTQLDNANRAVRDARNGVYRGPGVNTDSFAPKSFREAEKQRVAAYDNAYEKNKKYIKKGDWAYGKSERQIMSMQRKMQAEGLYSGKINGIWGDKSRRAYTKYADLQRRRKSTPINTGAKKSNASLNQKKDAQSNKKGYIEGESWHPTDRYNAKAGINGYIQQGVQAMLANGATTEECAEWANNVLLNARYPDGSRMYSYKEVGGDAWNRSTAGENSKIIYNGFDTIQLPKNATKTQLQRNNRKAVKNFASGFNMQSLDPNKNYAVTFSYYSSPNVKKAYDTMSNQNKNITSTHTGNAYYDSPSNSWRVRHNIHGYLYDDKLSDVIGTKNPQYGVSAIAELTKNMSPRQKRQLQQEQYQQEHPFISSIITHRDDAEKYLGWLGLSF